MEQSPGAFCEAPTTPNGDGGSMSPREQSSGAPESTASVPMADAVVTAVVTSTGDTAAGPATQDDVPAAEEATAAVPPCAVPPPAVDDSGEAKDVLVEDVPVESELQEAAGSAQIPAPAPGDQNRLTATTLAVHTQASAKQRRVSQASTLTLSSRRSSVNSATRRLSLASDGAHPPPKPKEDTPAAPTPNVDPTPAQPVSHSSGEDVCPVSSSAPAKPLPESVALATGGPPPARLPSDPPIAKAPARVFTRAPNQTRRPSADAVGPQAAGPDKVVRRAPVPSAASPVGQRLAQTRQLAQLASASGAASSSSSSSAPLLALVPAPTLRAGASPNHARSPRTSPQRASPSPNSIEVDTKALCSSIPQYMLSESTASPWHAAARRPRRQDPGSPASYPASPSHDADEDAAADSDGRTAQYRSEFYDNGDSYMGYMLEGVKHGRGVYLFANGSQYKGNWCSGTMHGWGVFIEQDTGDRFEGEWVDGERSFGVYYYSNGDMYHGAFLANKKQGRGVVWEKRLMYEVVYNQDICVEKSLWSTNVQRDQTKTRSIEREGQERLQQANQKLRARNALLAEKLARLELLLSQAEAARDRRPSTPMGPSSALHRPSSGPRLKDSSAQPPSLHRRKASEASAYGEARGKGTSDDQSSHGPSDRADPGTVPAQNPLLGQIGSVSPWKQELSADPLDPSLLRTAIDEDGRSAECPSAGSSMPPSPVYGNSPLRGGVAPPRRLPTTPSHSHPGEPLALCTTPTSAAAAPASSTHTEGHRPNSVARTSTPDLQDPVENGWLHGDNPSLPPLEAAPASHPASPPPPTSHSDHSLPKRKGKAPPAASHTVNSAVAQPQTARTAQSTPTEPPGAATAAPGPRRFSGTSRLFCPTEASLAKASTKHPSAKPRSASVEPVPRQGSPPKRRPPDSPIRMSPKSLEASTGLSSSLIGCRSPSPPSARKGKPIEELSAYDMSAERMKDVFRYYNNGPPRATQSFREGAAPPSSGVGSRTTSGANLSFGPRL
eukprot:EG_transcript_734